MFTLGSLILWFSIISMWWWWWCCWRWRWNCWRRRSSSRATKGQQRCFFMQYPARSDCQDWYPMAKEKMPSPLDAKFIEQSRWPIQTEIRTTMQDTSTSILPNVTNVLDQNHLDDDYIQKLRSRWVENSIVPSLQTRVYKGSNKHSSR